MKLAGFADGADTPLNRAQGQDTKQGGNQTLVTVI